MNVCPPRKAVWCVVQVLCCTLTALLTRARLLKCADMLRILPFSITSFFHLEGSSMDRGASEKSSAFTTWACRPSLYPRPVQKRLHRNQRPLRAEERAENEHQLRFGRTASAATCLVLQHVPPPQRRFLEKGPRQSPEPRARHPWRRS